jgi:putative sigma-54 modulation protein
LFAKKQCATFEEATDLAVDALKTQIKRYKERAQ